MFKAGDSVVLVDMYGWMQSHYGLKIGMVGVVKEIFIDGGVTTKFDSRLIRHRQTHLAHSKPYLLSKFKQYYEHSTI